MIAWNIPSFIIIGYDINLPTSLKKEWCFASIINFPTKELPISTVMSNRWARLIKLGYALRLYSTPLHQILDTPLLDPLRVMYTLYLHEWH